VHASLATARAAAPGLGLGRDGFERELAYIELLTLSPLDPSTQARLDAFLEANPKHQEAWETRIGLALRLSGEDSDAYKQTLVKAARATGDKTLRQAARRAELSLKLRRPFEGMDEAPSAGLLAAEFEDALDELGQDDPRPLLDRALAAGAHLPAEHLFALRLAAVDAMSTAPEALRQHFEPFALAVLAQLAGDPLGTGQLISVLVGLDEDDVALAALRGLVRGGADSALLTDLVRLLATFDPPELAESGFELVKRSLTKEQASALRRQLKESNRKPIKVDQRLYLQSIASMLEKIMGNSHELALSSEIKEDDEGLAGAGGLLRGLDSPATMARMAAMVIGLSPPQQQAIGGVIERLSPTQQANFGSQLTDIMAKGPARGADELRRFLLGILAGKVNL